MFCTKCGFDAQDAKFCPRCGSPITDGTEPQMNAQPQAATPQAGNNAQPQGAPYQAENNAQPQAAASETENSVPPQAGNNVPPQGGFAQGAPTGGQNFGMPGYNGAQGTVFYAAPKKKKRWPLITALVIVIVAVLGVGTYFAYPYVKEIISPRRQAVEALKSIGAEFAEAVDDVMDNSSDGVPVKQQAVGALSFDSFSADGEDFLSYVKVDTLQYDIQADAETGEVGGTIGLSSGNSDAVITLNFYMDGRDMYFNVPQLFSENFRVDLSDISGGDLDDIYSYYNLFGYYMQGNGSLDISAYSDVVNAAVNDVLSGYYKAVDEFEYKKLESTTLESDGLSAKVSSYRVTVTGDALISGVNEAIDSLFDDSQVSPYLGMLSAYGYASRESLKQSAANELADMQDFSFILYTRSGGRMAGLDVDLEDDVKLSVRSLADDLSEHVNISVSDVSDSVSVSFKEAGNETQMKFNMAVSGGDFFDIYISCQSDENTVTIKDFDINMDIDGTEFSLEVAGLSSAKEFSSMKFSPSYFKGALNPEMLTSSQQTALVNEFAQNGSILKKVVSDELYKSVDEYINLIKGTSSIQ